MPTKTNENLPRCLPVLRNVIHFEGATAKELARSFRDSIDSYLELCDETGKEPDRPSKFVGIEALPKRVTSMAADAQAIKTFIATTCA